MAKPHTFDGTSTPETASHETPAHQGSTPETASNETSAHQGAAHETSALQSLDRALSTQIELFETVTEDHDLLQKAVYARDWGLLEYYISRLQVRSGELVELEEIRRQAYAQLREELGLGPDDAFYDVLTRLNNDDRARLAQLYRRLKVAVMRMSGRNASLEHYVSTSSETLEEVLSELFPQRKGTIYGRSGKASARHGSAFVVNRSL